MEQVGSVEDAQVPHPLSQRFVDSLLNSTSSSNHVGLYTFTDNTFTDLRSFYDSIEGHVSSLGKSQEKYGDLLIPVIQRKIPAEVKQNLSREHKVEH